MENSNEATVADVFKLVVVFLFFLGACVFGGCYGYPKYNVWQQGLEGEAELNKAQASRQIAIAEASAKMESSKLLAQAEVERAKGVAQANEIIGKSLQGNEAYLHYLWVQELGSAQHVIYVPTEANMPILEAGRFGALADESKAVQK